MPELENRIGQWRHSLTIAFGGSDEIIDELESHLREEIDRQMQAGHSPEEALATAQAKLGRPTDLAAEYSRAVPPKRWFPISIGIPLFIILFASAIWDRTVYVIANGFGLEGMQPELYYTSLRACQVVKYYAAFLGLCYLVSRLVRPLHLGQLHSLKRSLIVANAIVASLPLTWIVVARIRFHVWYIQLIVELIPALWFAALAVGFGINPKRLHLFAVLSVASISADFWWHLISRLLLFPLPARSFDKWDLVRVVLYTIVPLSIASLGLLPAGRLARRVTS